MMINVRVKTNQKSFSIKKNGIWTISLKSSPEKGFANKELIKEMSKIYRSVKIVSGFKSRSKKLEIET